MTSEKKAAVKKIPLQFKFRQGTVTLQHPDGDEIFVKIIKDSFGNILVRDAYLFAVKH